MNCVSLPELRFGPCLICLAHEDRGRKRGNGCRPGLQVEVGLPCCWIAGLLLNHMQVQRKTLQTAVSKVHLRIGCVEDDENVLVLSVVPAVGIQLHHDQSRNLARACIEEGEILLDLSIGGHAEKTGTVADLQQVLKCSRCVRNVCGLPPRMPSRMRSLNVPMPNP